MAKRTFRRLTRGFTLAEVLIGVSISTAVMMGVVSLQYISARTIKEIYGQTRTRSSRMRALDQVYYRLGNARIGSVEISQNEHRIEFKDPLLGGDTSAFYFVEMTETLFYDDDIDDSTPAIEAARGPIDVTFEIDQAGALISLKVKSQAYMAYGDVDIQEGETAVYLRNPAS